MKHTTLPLNPQHILAGSTVHDKLFDRSRGEVHPDGILTGDTVLGRGTTVVAHPDGRLSEYLDSLHRLRSLAHIIDMHQMSKDPAPVLGRSVPAEPAEPAGPERVSPRTMSARDYGLYLEYCSELLSLTSKAAALCAEAGAWLVLDNTCEWECRDAAEPRPA